MTVSYTIVKMYMFESAHVYVYVCVAVCTDGSMMQYSFTAEGHCNREAYDIFLDLAEDRM